MLHKITLAATNTQEILEFYSRTLGLTFNEIKAYGTSLYSTRVNGIEVMICPNSIANVKADQARHQFEFVIDDLEKTLSVVEAIQGTEVHEMTKSGNSLLATVSDPDGNLVLFIQKLI